MQENEEDKKTVKKGKQAKKNTSKAVSSKKEKVKPVKEKDSKSKSGKDIKEKNSKGTNKKTVTVTEKSNKVIKSEPVKSVQKKKKESNITTKSKNIKKEVSKKNKLKTEKNASVKKVSDNKGNTKIDEIVVIEKIKDFISKVVAMQDEAKKEITDKKPKDKNISQKQNKPKKEKTEYIIEYYDLPYRYNETIVKILAQTPKKIFVYWDISDNDRNKYIETFGENFFETTYPVLLLYNEDKQYVKEVVINDFANSWYIDIDNTKTKYNIQLGRKFKNQLENYDTEKLNKNNIILKTDYLPFANSNILEVPNDHVLLEQLPEFIVFRNVKTNSEFTKNIRDLKDIFGNNYDIREFYESQYSDELEEGMFDMSNPSSNVMSSTFK